MNVCTRDRVVQMMLLGFVVEHWPDALLLDYLFYSERDEVWSVSMRNKDWMESIKYGEWCYSVLL
jgi:hypothetical protein